MNVSLLNVTLFWQIFAAFRKKRQFHIYRLHKEIVIKSSIVCLRNETNVKQTTDICHLATVFVVITELASIAIKCTEIHTLSRYVHIILRTGAQ